MARYLDFDNDRWEVRLGMHPPHPGVGTVLFHPVNNQRPYRVVEVEGNRFASQEALERLDDAQMHELFDRADIMDYVHERKAAPHHATQHVHDPTDVEAR